MKRRDVLFVFLLLCVGAPAAGAQQFGGSLAISGNQVLVGEARQSTFPGIVYVFERAGDAWRETAQLMVADASLGAPDGFGRALAFTGRTLLVGAPLTNGHAGAVHVYQSGASGAWNRVGTVASPSESDSAGFGSAVVANADVVAIAAPGDLDGAGAVHVFRLQAGALIPQATLRAEGTQNFGTTITVEGDLLLAGNPERRDAPPYVHAFRLDRASQEWVELGTLGGEMFGERSGFGTSLALRDGRAFVGAPGLNQRVGAVFVFSSSVETGEWFVETQLAPFEARPNTQFGASIAFDGDRTWVGAPGDGDGAGATYAFDQNATGAWLGVRKVMSDALEGAAGFGSSSATGAAVAVVGAGRVDRGGGAVAVFERGRDGGWSERATLVNEMRGFPAVTGGEIECGAGRAVGFACGNVNVLSFLPIKDIGGQRGTSVNDIWGWTDSETGREYAIVGRTDGTSFVDITDPLNPRYLGDLPKTGGSSSSIWRDMKVYRDHVYIVADAAGEHGVQVFDLRQLRTLHAVPVTLDETYRYDGINSAHNIVINEETGYAYAVGSSGGGETCGGGLHMINLANPGQPTFAGCFADRSTGRRKTGYSHDAQCVTYRGPDIDHQGKEICMGSNETALSIADVSNKNNPVALAMISYPNVAYTHQGWFSEDHRYFYQNDEGDEPQGLVDGTRTLVWDVTDLDDPVLVKEYIAETTTTDHNLYIRGDVMYQSNYGSGLRVIDISDPENPVEIGFFDTTPYGGGGSWSNYPYFESGVIIATSMGDGLFVLKATKQPPLTP